MKKTITAFAAILVFNAVTAQVKIAAKAGWNYSTARAVYTDVRQPTDFTFGYGAGILVKIPFEGILNFSPSVMINRRGFVVKPNMGTNIKEQYSITYLDLIPSLSVDFPNHSNSFVISLGPDFGFTNFGKIKVTDINNISNSQNLKFGYGAYGWFDIGLNASVGYHMKKIFIELGYLHGLTSINNNEEFDQRNLRNRTLSLNFGYYFK
jgi:hypothetical protein